MQNSVVETLIGAAVVAVAVLFLAFAYTSTGSGPVSGYEVLAKFNRADGVNIGTDVRLSSIKVGTVSKLSLDPKSYNAVVTIAMPMMLAAG
jgi:phospholipid/cholesterol/gamma-HCH transport system substrate-binding protein